MEYVNIDSLVQPSATTAAVADQLLARFGDTPGDRVLATDTLELVRGADLVDAARARGDAVVPLRRVGLIRETKDFPKRVLLELTTACNSDCTMCPRNVLTRPIQHMKKDVAKRTIDELAAVGLSGLWLYNIGESLLHPDFFEILAHASQYDSLGTIWLSTNGHIMDPAMAEKVLDAGVDMLNYSVNAMSAESFAKVAPKLSFQRVQDHLRHLIALKHAKGAKRPLIRAQMIEMPDVAHEMAAFLAEFGSQVDILSINTLEVFSQNVEENTRRAGESTENTRILKCNRLEREDYFIFADGSVSCCDTDFNCEFNIGNVGNSSVREVFNGEKYQSLLALYRDGRLHEHPLCAKCRDYAL